MSKPATTPEVPVVWHQRITASHSMRVVLAVAVLMGVLLMMLLLLHHGTPVHVGATGSSWVDE